MPQFHSTERLGAVQSTTREGFLLCEGVPVSRTGILHYAPNELPIPPGPDGLIHVHRSEDDVFAPTAIASFEGKSVVDLHPGVDVTPQNWRMFAVGHMQNVRRGTDDQANHLLADLVIKDQAAINAVRSGKRHVSLGYDAAYSVFAPGHANQTNIIGNHVALVPQGRCGPTCSIGDADMPNTAPRTWMDRIRSAFTAQDETMLAAALAEAPTGEASGTNVPVIHVHTGDRDGAKDPQREFAQATADALTALAGSVKEVSTKLGDLDGKVAGIVAKQTADAEAKAAAEAKATKDAEEAKALKEAEEAAAKDKEAKEREAKEAKAKTGDSAGLATVFQDTLSRAEFLIPGVQLPTFDAAANPQATENTLCGFRRRVLIAAQTSGTGREHVNAMMPVGGDISAMSCDAVATTFQGATEIAKVANNRRTPSAGGGGGGANGKVGPLSPAEINARNNSYYYPGAKK